MRVICAPDKFKQCCTAFEAAEALATGVLSVAPDAEVIQLPVADGGEGTLDALREQFPERRKATVQDALGREVEAEFALNGKRALVESAQACGLWRLDEFERDPNATHTFGVGQLIKAALNAGANDILVGVGGSATNDGGAGMAHALGAQFLGRGDEPIFPKGENLSGIRRVDLSGLDSRLKSTKFTALCDVMSPLVGEDGASRQFVAQKGGSTQTSQKLETGLEVLSVFSGKAGAEVEGTEPGTGAGGGLGFGIQAFLRGRITHGAKEVMREIGFRELIESTDFVLTGEGSCDSQTKHGKLISVLAEYCMGAGVPLIVLAGAVSHDFGIEGVTGAFGISSYGTRKQDVLDAGTSNLTRHAAYITQIKSTK